MGFPILPILCSARGVIGESLIPASQHQRIAPAVRLLNVQEQEPSRRPTLLSRKAGGKIILRDDGEAGGRLHLDRDRGLPRPAGAAGLAGFPVAGEGLVAD